MPHIFTPLYLADVSRVKLISSVNRKKPVLEARKLPTCPWSCSFSFSNQHFLMFTKREPLIKSEWRAASWPSHALEAVTSNSIVSQKLMCFRHLWIRLTTMSCDHEINRTFSRITPIKELFVNYITHYVFVSLDDFESWRVWFPSKFTFAGVCTTFLQ